MSLIVSLVLIGIGVAILFWTSQRRFNRRNVAGVEEFRSYAGLLLVRLLETSGRIMAWLLVIAGAGGLLTGFIADR